MHVCDTLELDILNGLMILYFFEILFLTKFRNLWIYVNTIILTAAYYPLRQVSSLGFHINTKKRTLALFQNSCIRIFENLFFRNYQPWWIFSKTHISRVFRKRSQSFCIFFEKYTLISFRKWLNMCLRKFFWSFFRDHNLSQFFRNHS